MQRLFNWLEPSAQAPTGPRHPRHPGWKEYTPTLRVGSPAQFHRVTLRPLEFSDAQPWSEQRKRNQAVLEAVEPTIQGSWEQAHSMQGWKQYFYPLNQAAYQGRAVPFAIVVDGHFAGQITLDELRGMPWQDCVVGYWVDALLWGRGIATAACALAVDHAFRRVGVHRVQATYLPDNPASGAVLQSVGFEQEGLLRGNMHINGRWQDHFCVGLNRDRYTSTAVERLKRAGRVF
ncbi:GNAT family N-acetyltransferase [Corynebacterium pelargi]|uniref:Ribosomal N-acetyltransferase YdaF n=1 Tax=Corynebacterium pelargi TaxID=1471400 RepID=A0A410WA02_9CORY|nr:GNAT family protein [Corynebacterium pelargi]QAU52769.1 Putative ribosomal N-acetyltransferase YdaF [Corynebacterium pelargi]GGG78648.1 acetyltransferase [Corynebacterium pelargi]